MPRYRLRAQKLLTLTNYHKIIVRVLPGPPSPLVPERSTGTVLSLAVSIAGLRVSLEKNKISNISEVRERFRTVIYIEMPFYFQEPSLKVVNTALFF
ncbi:hypothetical protein Baya_1934 [Bagarius yarrelli]|uniref:Uncharacterized protein n=1 Tax=Bagarius yarrelli TaxID=175774 RepID=A0A556TMI7_BAGYA|nr:hypothetical protein Baya_1934 [Bagarius yarrelli]